MREGLFGRRRTGEIIALLDERFLQSSYQRTFPREWSDYQICSLETVKEQMERFWNETDERERMKKDWRKSRRKDFVKYVIV